MGIMTHDLTIALATSLAVIDSMVGKYALYSREKREQLRVTPRQGRAIIRRVAHVERLRHLDLPLEEIDLDKAVRDGIACHPGLRVRYDGTEERVMADIFLSGVFVNLLGDSRHFGGSGVNGRIRVEAGEDEVLVPVEDDGPGITVRKREERFVGVPRAEDGDAPVEERGLGLSIAGALVRRCVGRIWARDLPDRECARGTVIRIPWADTRPQRREKRVASRPREKVTIVGLP